MEFNNNLLYSRGFLDSLILTVDDNGFYCLCWTFFAITSHRRVVHWLQCIFFLIPTSMVISFCFFTDRSIPSRFNNGVDLNTLIEQICSGEKQSKDIPAIQVIWYSDKWEWYTLNNRRLYVFQQLEKKGKLVYCSMVRVEFTTNVIENPPALFKAVDLYTPTWDIDVSSNNLKVGTTTRAKKDTLKCLAKLAGSNEGAMDVDEQEIAPTDEYQVSSISP